jgi:hypothetical protein
MAAWSTRWGFFQISLFVHIKYLEKILQIYIFFLEEFNGAPLTISWKKIKKFTILEYKGFSVLFIRYFRHKRERGSLHDVISEGGNM